MNHLVNFNFNRVLLRYLRLFMIRRDQKRTDRRTLRFIHIDVWVIIYFLTTDKAKASPDIYLAT